MSSEKLILNKIRDIDPELSCCEDDFEAETEVSSFSGSSGSISLLSDFDDDAEDDEETVCHEGKDGSE